MERSPSGAGPHIAVARRRRRYGTLPAVTLALGALALPASEHAFAAAPARSLAARAARFEPVRAAIADFSQEREVSLVADVLRAHGTIALRAPDAMRLDLDEPEPFTLLADGARVAMVDARGNRQELPPELAGLAGFSRDLTGLLLGGKTNDRFTEEWQDDTVTLRPHETTGPFAEITLRFAADAPLPTEVVLRERGGDRTTIRLGAVRLNPAIDPARFLPPLTP